MTDCPSAMNALSRRRMHNLDRCGFQGSIEVVCCPQTDVREFKEDNERNSNNNNNSKPTTWGESDEETNESKQNSRVKQKKPKRKSEIGK